MAMIAHWDDVPWRAHEHGELRYEHQRLGAAVHADEEEGIVARVERLDYWDGEGS